MRDFAAIDFETANHHPQSVCSVGVVIVRNGEIDDTFYSLVRPTPPFYSRYNTAVHGLTKADTDDAERFPEVWSQIAGRLENLPLVAHNSRFDEGCLRAVHHKYSMPWPGYSFHCTCSHARRYLPGLPNYQLHTVSAACGFFLDNHHHALADAEAAAEICRYICARFGDEAMFPIQTSI